MTYFDKTPLPEKLILSGADCFHLVLDKHAKKHGAGGNVMRKVFYFNRTLEREKIHNILKNSPVIYWLCNIKLVQPGFFRLPYWHYKNKGNEIILREHEMAIPYEIPLAILKRDIQAEASRFIEADLVYYPSGGCAFVLSWNHILLDAKGSTLLFDHLNQLSENSSADAGQYFPGKEKKIGIISHIRNMYKVKHFIQHSARPGIRSVANRGTRSDKCITQTKVISFTREETQTINENAVKAGSRFGATLYLVACCSQVVHRLNKQRNNAGDLWIPVPYDGRLRGAVGPLVSNRVSFLFYRIPQKALNNITETVSILRSQMSDQIKKDIPKKYNQLLNLMRHLPLWFYYFLISNTNRGSFASFLYTSSGDNFNNLRSLFGESIQKIGMIPALTFPPGLSFVFLKHEDTLHLNIAYSPAVINEQELALLEPKLKQLILSGR